MTEQAKQQAKKLPMDENTIENEIRDIAKEEVSKLPPVEFPKSIEVSNFPEPKAPIVNVSAPIVNVKAPIVNVPDVIVPEIKIPDIKIPENTSSNALLSEIRDLLAENDPERFDKLEKAVRESKSVHYGNSGWKPVVDAIEDNRGVQSTSTKNTTTTPLASSATYTGTWEQNTYPDVMVSCITDNSGTLYFDFSVDGTNVNTFPTNGFVLASGTHEFHIARKGARYFRARLVNDSGAQTYLRLYTYYGQFGQAMAPLNQQTSTDADAILVRQSYDPLEAARGKITGVAAVNKFGQAPSGVQTTLTDIWGRADATPTQQIWLAPTAARVHAIVSTSDLDGKTAAPSSVGARTLRVWGLKTWATAETSEDITLDGTTAVNTVNSYVIIHRMKVLTSGSTSINVGTISATAATDSTITAVILPSKGQTQLAIYGIPSTQTLYITSYELAIHDTGGTAKAVDAYLVVNENPDVQTKNFIIKTNGGAITGGTSHYEKEYNPYFKVPGPAIVKIQATSTAADTDCSAGFDGYLITN